MKLIRSSFFSRHPEVIFGMSTRTPEMSFGNNMSFNVGDDPQKVGENRTHFFSFLNINAEMIAAPVQEHTDTVAICSVAQRYSSCDALLTSTKGIVLSVSIADCTPIMMYDTKRKVIAAIHAGWRGTSKKIVSKALMMMRETFRSEPMDIIAYIGPSAGACCYEVGNEVAVLFPASCVETNDKGELFLDVKKANLLQLLEYGVPESHIEMNSDCSIHNEQYHSFRRDGLKSGRMLAVIGLKN